MNTEDVDTRRLDSKTQMNYVKSTDFRTVVYIHE